MLFKGVGRLKERGVFKVTPYEHEPDRQAVGLGAWDAERRVARQVEGRSIVHRGETVGD